MPRLFAAGSHSRWMNAYYGGKPAFGETHVYTLGNPLIAITMIEHDRDASLFAPVEFLVKELEEGKGADRS